MQKLMTLMIALLVLAYPFAIYVGINHFSPRYLGLFLALLFCLRYMLTTKSQSAKQSAGLLAIIALVISIIAALSNHIFAIKLYPVAINLVMLCVFFHSLRHPPSIAEKFARLRHPDFPPAAVSYTRKVTAAWCVFFFCNGSIALFTALFCSLKVWTLYNGFLAYLFIAVFFLIEFLIRLRVIKHQL